MFFALTANTNINSLQAARRQRAAVPQHQLLQRADGLPVRKPDVRRGRGRVQQRRRVRPTRQPATAGASFQQLAAQVWHCRGQERAQQAAMLACRSTGKVLAAPVSYAGGEVLAAGMSAPSGFRKWTAWILNLRVFTPLQAGAGNQQQRAAPDAAVRRVRARRRGRQPRLLQHLPQRAPVRRIFPCPPACSEPLTCRWSQASLLPSSGHQAAAAGQ